MIRFLNKRRVTFGLLLWFIFVFLIAYLSWGRTGAERPEINADGTSNKSTRTVHSTEASASPSIDSDNDGIPDAAELSAYAVIV